VSTRRELLFGLIGSAALGACRRAPTQDFDGGFAEDGTNEGHRLRDGWSPTVEVRREVPVVIVGGGVAGLTAGWALRRRGFERFEIFELGQALGGTAISGSGAGGPFPWGAHYVPAPPAENEALVSLFAELGAVSRESSGLVFAEEHLVAAPKERAWYRGSWYHGLYPAPAITAEDRAQLVRFESEIDRLVGLHGADGRRWFTLPTSLASQDPLALALDGITFAEWLTKNGFDSPMLRFLSAYACRDDFGTEPEHTSAWYGLHYFAARIERPGEESAELLAWPEGNARLVRHLAESVGSARIRTAQVVLQIAPDPRGAAITVYDRTTHRAELIVAERVIVAAPAHVRSRILAFPELPKYAPTIAPWLVANLQLADHPGYQGAELAWDNVIHGSKSLGFVVNNHRDGPARGPTTFSYYWPLTGEDPVAERKWLYALSYREAADLVLADLERCHSDLRRQLRRLDVWRWGHGMVRPTPGMMSDLARRSLLRPHGPLHFAHTDLSGVALFEEAFDHGQRAAAEVLAAMGRAG
jgi:protoporphyrinogen oxidase